MKKQYLVTENDTIKRKQFYEYIHKKYKLKDYLNKKEIINNNFPIVVDFNDNSVWVCTSITCCACAAQNNQIINIKQFKEMEKH